MDVSSFLLFKDNLQDLGRTQDQLNEYMYTAQSVYFITLVLIQFGNLCSTRTRHLSFFQHLPYKKPTRNPYLLGAVVLSVSFALLVVSFLLYYILFLSLFKYIYIPFFNSLFNTRPIPTEFWFIP